MARCAESGGAAHSQRRRFTASRVADFAVLAGKHLRLPTEDAGYAPVEHACGWEAVFLTQDLAYALEQAIAAGLRQVPGLNQGGVPSAAGASHGDHGLPSSDTLRDQQRFVVWLVDGVDDHMRPFGKHGVAVALV